MTSKMSHISLSQRILLLFIVGVFFPTDISARSLFGNPGDVNFDSFRSPTTTSPLATASVTERRIEVNSTDFHENFGNHRRTNGDEQTTKPLLSTLKTSASRFITTRKPRLFDTINSGKLCLQNRNVDRTRLRSIHNIKIMTQLKGGAETVDEESSTEPEKPPSFGRNAKAFLHHRKRTLLPKLKDANDAAAQKVMNGLNVLQETSTQVAPSFLTFLSVLWRSDKGISFLSLYALALLGASCGFYLFLYFITVGYAMGITLPLIAAIYIYKLNGNLSRPTLFHSYMTIAWGVRMVVFFLWREYFSWPALHKKVLEVQSKIDIPFVSRLLCWLVYSFFYVAMMTSNWSRLQSNSRWGLLGYTGMLLQIAGLVLETIADMQKNSFKSKHRHSWCNAGVWQWSTHPNYLGEGLFWWGTYLAHGFDSLLHSLLATIGLLFVMVVLKGSTRSLSRKHLEKYGDQPHFCEFQRTHSIWGPKNWRWRRLHGLQESSKQEEETNISLPVINDNTTDTTVLAEEVSSTQM